MSIVGKILNFFRINGNTGIGSAERDQALEEIEKQKISQDSGDDVCPETINADACDAQNLVILERMTGQNND